MAIKGTVEKITQNKGGFYAVKVNGEWYGTGKKDEPGVGEGDTVSFDYYKKDGKWLTVKGAINRADRERPAAGSGGSKAEAGGRGGYWENKAASDAAKEPRIAFQGAYERALEQFRILKDAGAYPSLEKVKTSEKLGLVRSLIEAEANHIMHLAWHATAPDAPSEAPEEAEESPEDEDGELEG